MDRLGPSFRQEPELFLRLRAVADRKVAGLVRFRPIYAHCRRFETS